MHRALYIKSHAIAFLLLRTRRFLMLSLIIFMVQYINIINLSFAYPSIPMYPPIGIAFIMFYTFGNNALLGLVFGGALAYILKGLPIEMIGLYLLADIVCGYLGATLSKNVFSSDIQAFTNRSEAINFIKLNALVTCALSCYIRANAGYLAHLPITISECINLWIADLNAIIMYFSFISTWINAANSREKISERKIPNTFMVSLLAFVLFCMYSMRKIELIYLLIPGMLAAIYFARIYGHVIATGLLALTSTIYLAYFVAHKQQFVNYFGYDWYTLVPVILFIYINSMLLAQTKPTHSLH